MEDMLIYLLTFGIGALLGYIISMIRISSLEQSLSKHLLNGSKVSILVDDKGVAYKIEDGKVKVTNINAKEIEND